VNVGLFTSSGDTEAFGEPVTNAVRAQSFVQQPAQLC
jgi:hypothetical protein